MLSRFIYSGLMGLVLVALASCGASADQSLGFSLRDRLHQLPGLAWLNPVTPMAEVSQRQRGTAYLAGQVEQHLPLVNQFLYQLQDDSGRIWVLTSEPPPAVGEFITIRATIHYEPILMRGQDIGEHYAEELQRLVSEP